MRYLFGFLLLLTACGSPLTPAAAPSLARVVAAQESELTLEIQELI